MHVNGGCKDISVGALSVAAVLVLLAIDSSISTFVSSILNDRPSRVSLSLGLVADDMEI